METSIPQIIHQTWKTEDVPYKYREFQKSWIDHHPNWEYKFWTDKDNLTLISDQYPWLLSTYESFPYSIQRVDVARILYLHAYGGIYADLDLECLKPTGALLKDHAVVLGRECKGMGTYIREHDYVSNSFMASVPGHPFWEDLLHEILRCTRPRYRLEPVLFYVLSTTGPRMLDKVVTRYSQSDMIVFPKQYFCPATPLEQDISKRRVQARRDGSYTVHHFSGSWIPTRLKVLIRTAWWITTPTGLVVILIIFLILLIYL